MRTVAPNAAAPAYGARVSWLPLAAVVAVGALLRFVTLGTQSLWFDEAATWDLMQLPLGEMLDALPRRESNPPLFYVLEWFTTRALGDSEAALRALSATAGTLLIVIAWAIGRRIGGTRVALATAALIAVNPLLVWFSQEARNYELVALFSALSLLLFLRALDDERPRVLAWWAVASGLALATHYFSAFALAPQIAWLLWRHPRRGAVAAATAALALATAALLPMLLEQRGNPYDIAHDAIVVRLAQIPKQFLLGYRGPLALPAGLLGAALVVAATWLLARDTPPPLRRRALLVGGVGLCGIALPLAAAVVGADYLNTRNLLPALVPLAAALATAVVAVPRRAPALGPALIGALCALSLAVVVMAAADSAYHRPDWRGLAEALGRSEHDRPLVISPANGEVPLRYYRRGLRPLGTDGVRTDEVDVVGVAGSDGPGSPQRLPDQVGTVFGTYGFGEPVREQHERFVILRFIREGTEIVTAGPLPVVRFSEEPPSVSVLPAGG